MPQLEAGDWPTQVFWLAVTFIILLLLMWKVALPRVGGVIEERRRRIEDDLAQAEKLKNEADEALRAYQQALDEARATAQAMIAETRKKLDAEAAERKAALEAQLDTRIAEAEARIGAAREKAMANIRELALDVATSATAKLTGNAPDGETVAAAVDAELGRKD
jgi:F-type H+-transporting ATPase subunit b